LVFAVSNDARSFFRIRATGIRAACGLALAMFHHDLNHTGRSPYPSAQTGVEKWNLRVVVRLYLLLPRLAWMEQKNGILHTAEKFIKGKSVN